MRSRAKGSGGRSPAKSAERSSGLAALALWGAAFGVFFAAVGESAAEPVSPPRGCEGVATILYERCEIAHVYACAGYPNGRVVEIGRIGGPMRTQWRAAGLLWERIAYPEPEPWVVTRRFAPRDAAAAARSLAPGAFLDIAFDETVARPGRDPERTRFGARVAALHPETLELESGPERVRVFVSTAQSADGWRLTTRRLFSDDLGVVVGWRISYGERRLRDAQEIAPRAILRAGDPGFLEDGVESEDACGFG